MSTREPAGFRDALVPLGVTTMSAGSHTEPGGYASPSDAEPQFSISDTRSPRGGRRRACGLQAMTRYGRTGSAPSSGACRGYSNPVKEAFAGGINLASQGTVRPRGRTVSVHVRAGHRPGAPGWARRPGPPRYRRRQPQNPTTPQPLARPRSPPGMDAQIVGHIVCFRQNRSQVTPGKNLGRGVAPPDSVGGRDDDGAVLAGTSQRGFRRGPTGGPGPRRRSLPWRGKAAHCVQRALSDKGEGYVGLPR